ncbi:MAG: aminodeoxychorismate/anthranilate synthase component II [Candidatus Dormibacteraeota bacterium]|nr:aminodeoxychorismate/anthranilate synthase component II [Candidatus Dormibacteraeota bacterium]
MSASVIVIDNYDSFTYNLVQAVAGLDVAVTVYRNDAVTVEDVARAKPLALILSPGPGTPRDAGICPELIRHLGPTTPMLGVCLGHQCIGEVYGATVSRAAQPMHGKVSRIHHDGRSIFSGLPDPFEATRYHSLIVERSTVPAALRVTAWTDDEVVMGLEHLEHPVVGVQFHPESILTVLGTDMLARFIDVSRRWRKPATGSASGRRV